MQAKRSIFGDLFKLYIILALTVTLLRRQVEKPAPEAKLPGKPCIALLSKAKEGFAPRSLDEAGTEQPEHLFT